MWFSNCRSVVLNFQFWSISVISAWWRYLCANHAIFLLACNGADNVQWVSCFCIPMTLNGPGGRSPKQKQKQIWLRWHFRHQSLLSWFQSAAQSLATVWSVDHTLWEYYRPLATLLQGDYMWSVVWPATAASHFEQGPYTLMYYRSLYTCI